MEWRALDLLDGITSIFDRLNFHMYLLVKYK